MKICSAVVDITPDVPLPLSGYSTRSSPFEAVDQPLQANLLLLQDQDRQPVVLAALDTLFVGSTLHRTLAEKLDISPARLLLVSSHTHAAPSLTPETAGLGRYDPRYGETTASSLASAIDTMLRETPQEVSLHVGRQTTRQNANRRRLVKVPDFQTLRRYGRWELKERVALSESPTGVVDRRLHLVALKNGAGSIVAIIWSFAAHPAFFPKPGYVSPDYPGEVRRLLREAFGANCAVLYLPGLAGSAIPRIPWRPAPTVRGFLRQLNPFNHELKFFTPRTYRSWCRRLARTAIQCARGGTAEVPSDPVSVRMDTVPGIFSQAPDRVDSLVDLHICRLSFGPDFDILLTSGETLGEWAELLADTVPTRTLMSGYLSGRPIYVPTAKVIAEGGYEVQGFQAAFGLDGTFIADINERVATAIATLFVSHSARTITCREPLDSAASVAETLSALSHATSGRHPLR